MNASRRTRVFIADDHAAIRAGLETILEERGFDVVGQTDSAEGAIEAATAGQADVLVVDLNMGETRGAEIIDMLLKQVPELRVVVYSMRETMPMINAAYEAGAKAYVTKSSSLDLLVKAIEEVAAGTTYFMPGVGEQLALYHTSGVKEVDPARTLAERDLLIFTRLAEGHPVSDIAEELDVPPKTIANRVTIIGQKLGIKRGEFTKAAIKYNLIDAL